MLNLHFLAATLLAGATALSHAATEPAIVTSIATIELRYELTDLDLLDNILPAIQFTDRSVSSTNSYRDASGAIERVQRSTFGESAIARFGGYARTDSTPTSLRSETGFVLADPNAHMFSAENRLTLNFVLTPSTQVRLIGAAEFTTTPTGERVTLPRYMELLAFIYGPVGFGNGQGWSGEGRGDLTGVLSTGPEGAPGMVTLQALTQLEVAAVPEPSAAALLLAGLVPVLIRARRRRMNP